jgi:hypothetical protein
MRGRFTWDWVILGGFLALVVVAGVDALRTSGREPSRPTTATRERTTGAPRTDEALDRCTRRQIAVSIEVRGGVPTNVVRQVGASPCRLAAMGIHLTITDRAGYPIYRGAIASFFGGDMSPGAEQTLPLPNPIEHCRHGGPFLAAATIGPYSARGTVSGDQLGC